MMNTSRHPLVSTLMEPLEHAGIDWPVSKICKAAEIKGGVMCLPVILQWCACYRYILGK